MTKLTPLYEVQIGQETSRGAEATPTAILMGAESCVIKPIEESVIVPELRGDLYPGYNAVQIRRAAECTIVTAASFEDLLYFLQSLFTEETTADTAAPYMFTFNPPSTAAATPQPLTIVYGDGTDDYSIIGALCSSLTLSCSPGELMKVQATFIGTDSDEDDEAVLSARTVEFIKASQFDLWIDAAAGTIGTNQIENCLFSFELTITPNRENVWHIDTTVLTPDAWKDGKWGGTLRLTMELTTGTGTADAQSWLADILDSSPIEKQIRLKASGTTSSLQIDFAGVVLEAPDLITDTNGVASLDMTFTGKYNAVLTDWLVIALDTSISVIP